MTAGWRKSSYSHVNGNCLEAGTGDTAWRKSSFSSLSECVEAGNGAQAVLVRDTADRGGAVLTFPPGAWSAFTASITGEGR